MNKKVLVTGAAGFIGFYLCKKLLKNGFFVVGLDNINDYYDVNLKFSRLEELGIEKASKLNSNVKIKSKIYKDKFLFYKMNLEDRVELPKIFLKHKFNYIFNIAAQAGVRYSIEKPEKYIDSNIVGFSNILECSRNFDVEHFFYASSSSVYGNNDKVPFSITDNVENPISLYAATKRANELMAYTYSHLYKLPTTGLRFFTVYGPWGRPDMAPMLFSKAIFEKTKINVFNNGKLKRDFTYIDDIIDGIEILLFDTFEKSNQIENYRIFNIGNGNPINLLDFIKLLEENLKLTAKKIFLPMQKGDVYKTFADISDLTKIGFKPKTDIYEGVKLFVIWYKKYYKR